MSMLGAVKTRAPVLGGVLAVSVCIVFVTDGGREFRGVGIHVWGI